MTEVEEQLAVPPLVSDRIWGTAYASHFYGPVLDRLRDKWEGGT